MRMTKILREWFWKVAADVIEEIVPGSCNVWNGYCISWLLICIFCICSFSNLIKSIIEPSSTIKQLFRKILFE